MDYANLDRFLTTNHPDAAAKLAQGIHHFNRWRADAMVYVDAALAIDPAFAMAHTVKGLLLFGGKNKRFAPMIKECLAQAQNEAAGVSEWERGYVHALQSLAAGRIEQSVVTLETNLYRHPTDLLAHRLVQQELFWMGEARWMRDIAARAAPAWSPEIPGYGTFLAVYAFGREETGDLEAAERLGRAAVEHDPQEPWGAHAVAHVMEMQARHAEGVDWLEGLDDRWEGVNQIAHHLWWHLCLFYLELGEHARILELLDTKVRNPDDPLVQAVPDAYIDIQNVAALLLRLDLRGVDVGARWESIADVAAQRIGNHPNLYTSVNAVMVLTATGRFDKAHELVESIREFAATSHHTLCPRAREAALPAAEAVIAHRRGDYAEVLRLLLPARRDLWRMGGSHAQRDVFSQILVDACRRLERHDELSILFDEIAAIGFARSTERTLYAEAAAQLA